ncbi:MAG: ribosome-associated translation inhibitor RaiA [Clostridia bacterium]|nr:ribosome-associated translation inhibitor RaiA [Clostridia bacterium]
MKLKLSSKKFRLTQDVTDRVDQKLEKLNKFFPEDTNCTVNITQQKNDVRVEITIQHRGVLFRAEVADREYLNALDRAQENILRQIRKNRTRLEKRKYISKDAELQPAFEAPNEADDEEEVRIRKIKTFRVDPMSPEEAVMQMNLLSHQFFAFRNAETGNIGVVYARADGTYGVIDLID